MNALLVAKAIRRVFAGGDGQLLEILRGVDVEVRRGEFVADRKSTRLNSSH